MRVHPADHGSAGTFHLLVGLIGVAHLIAGGLMIWFHLGAARRHWDELKKGEKN